MPAYLLSHIAKGTEGANIAQAQITAKNLTAVTKAFNDAYPEREITEVGIVGAESR